MKKNDTDMKLPIDLSKVSNIDPKDVHVIHSTETQEEYNARMREQYYWWDSMSTPDANAEGM